MPEKKTKDRLGQKNLAMLPSYFDHIFVPLKRKVCLIQSQIEPEIFVNFGTESSQTRPKSPAPTYISDLAK